MLLQQPGCAAAVGTGRDTTPGVTPKQGQDNLAKPEAQDCLPRYQFMNQMSS